MSELTLEERVARLEERVAGLARRVAALEADLANLKRGALPSEPPPLGVSVAENVKSKDELR